MRLFRASIHTLTAQGGSLGRDFLLRITTTPGGETPAMAAAKGGSVEVLEALAEAGAETGTTCRLSGPPTCAGVDCLMMASRWESATGGRGCM